jgi:hypothetical protein
MTLSIARQFTRSLTSCILIPLLGLPSSLPAQTHVVNPAELQRELAAVASARRYNTEVLNEALSSPRTEKAFEYAGIDPVRVKTAVSSLNDQELARLAARSETAKKDFAAGRISDRDLLIILVGIAALILIIVAVR